MTQLSAEAKESIVKKALNRGNKTIESIALSNNVGLSTLQKWLHSYREGLPLSRHQGATLGSLKFNCTAQFKHVLATQKLDDVSLGKYCREHGLYSHQLTEWKRTLMSSLDKPKQASSELKKLKEENKSLQRELRRKDKALAEASALLIMKKKADLIWGVDEDD